MRRLCVILAVVAALLPTALSCRKDGGEVIPRGKMARIYADMFITDQWINLHYKVRSQADTSLVYEPIFNKYGYDSDDYRASMAYYIQDPERYSKMMKKSSKILQSHLNDLKNEKLRLELSAGNNNYLPDMRQDKLMYIPGTEFPRMLDRDTSRYYPDEDVLNKVFSLQDLVEPLPSNYVEVR